jgi:cytochrome P450
MSQTHHDPVDPASIENPYPLYRELRAERSPTYVPDRDLWLVSSYEACEFVLTSPELFSSRESLSSTHAFRHPDIEEVLRNAPGYPRKPTLILTDPPAHTRYRRIMYAAFNPSRAARELAPRIQEIVDDLIDAFIEKGQCEFIEEFAYPLPMTVIASVLDVPVSELGLLKKWSDDFITAQAGNVPHERLVECARSTVEFEEYFQAKLQDRMSNPKDDFLGRLVKASEEDEEPLRMQEMFSLAQQLLVGGNETTTNLLGNMMWMVLSHPQLYERLLEDDSIVRETVEEVLRAESPLQGLFRVATEDVQIEGVTIPDGAKVMVLFGSANRDESTFEVEGFNEDLDTPNLNRHLAFGKGIHHCMGPPLARREAQIALETLVRRLPGLRLSEGQSLSHVPQFGFRGLKELWLEFDPARSSGERGSAGSQARSEV